MLALTVFAEERDTIAFEGRIVAKAIEERLGIGRA